MSNYIQVSVISRGHSGVHLMKVRNFVILAYRNIQNPKPNKLSKGPGEGVIALKLMPIMFIIGTQHT